MAHRVGMKKSDRERTGGIGKKKVGEEEQNEPEG